MLAYCLMLGGMRANELAHMRRDWVRPQEATVVIPPRQPCVDHEPCRTRVRVEARRVGGEWKRRRVREHGFWMPKTKWGARTIPMRWDPAFAETVRDFYRLHAAFGRPRQTVYKIVKRLANRAGIPEDVYPHALRATAATRLAEAGVNEHNMRAYMGWSVSSTAPYAYLRAGAAGLSEALMRNLGPSATGGGGGGAPW